MVRATLGSSSPERNLIVDGLRLDGLPQLRLGTRVAF